MMQGLITKHRLYGRLCVYHNVHYYGYRRLLLPLVVALFLLLLLPSFVQGHAILVRSTPADGATLAAPPQAIQLWFDEPVAANFSSVRLLAADNQQVSGLAIEADPTDPYLLIVTLPVLQDGVYTLLWKVFSEADGHYSQGLYVVGIGTGATVDAATLDSTTMLPTAFSPSTVPWRESLLRWLHYGWLTALVGAVALLSFRRDDLPGGADVAEIAAESAALRATHRLFVARLHWWAIIAAAALFVAALGLLVEQAVTLQTATSDGTLLHLARQLLMETRWGALWLVRQTLLVALLILLIRDRADVTRTIEPSRSDPAIHQPAFRRPFFVLVPSLLLVAMLLAQAATGHANGVTRGQLLATVNATIHIAAAGIWIGGLLALGVTIGPLLLRRSTTAVRVLQQQLRRFGWWAAGSVGLLFATGFYSIGQQVASPDALFLTGYGRTLLAKMGIVVMVGAFGAINTLLLHPGLAARLRGRAADTIALRAPLRIHHLPLLVGGEVLLGITVLFATGILTATPPPRGAAFMLTPADLPSALSQTVDDLVVTLGVKPNRPGQNVFQIVTATSLRPAPAEIVRVLLRLRSLDTESGQVTAVAEEVEPGRYLLTGNYLSLAGRWEVEVVTRRAGMEDSIAHFHWRVAPPGVVQDPIFSKRPLYVPMTLMAVGIFLLLGAGLVGRRILVAVGHR